MAPIEAMLMRRMVIGFGIGGSTDFLKHMKTALIVQRQTPHDLGLAMALSAEDPVLREKLGVAGEHHVRQLYSPKRILYRMRAMYQRLKS